jgi:hypothetical protein
MHETAATSCGLAGFFTFQMEKPAKFPCTT